jgi:hypothetical protein
MQDRTRDAGRLAYLNELDDYKVADQDPDIRGWNVSSSDGSRLGKVSDLLVDTEAMKVRYIEVELEDPVSAGTSNRYTLVPIGVVQLHAQSDDVLLDVDAARFTTVPRRARGAPLDRDQEVLLVEPYRRPSQAATAEEDFYGHVHFDDQRWLAGRGRSDGTRTYLRRS